MGGRSRLVLPAVGVLPLDGRRLGVEPRFNGSVTPHPSSFKLKVDHMLAVMHRPPETPSNSSIQTWCSPGAMQRSGVGFNLHV